MSLFGVPLVRGSVSFLVLLELITASFLFFVFFAVINCNFLLHAHCDDWCLIVGAPCTDQCFMCVLTVLIDDSVWGAPCAD